MVVRILKNSTTFSGVTYNEKRVSNGEAELCITRNFGEVQELFRSSYNYRDYLQDWSDRNKRIKNPQLHVSISAPGKKVSKEELLSIAEDWLKRMGYGDVPYMIYFHNNTDNNHIHIVTSRIDKDGNKINNNFDKERSVRILNEIEKERIGEDKDKELRNSVAGFLHYSFANMSQLAAIMESCELDVQKTNDGELVVRKGGVKPVIISKSLIDFCSQRYRKALSDEKRKQMFSIFMKYSKIGNRKAFKDAIKIKFGIDLIFFGEKDKPYGYCIIDHHNKAVFKGSEVCKMNYLLGEINKYKDFDYKTIVDVFLEKNRLATTRELNRYISRYQFKYDGMKFVSKISGEVIYSPDDKIRQQIKYNNKLSYICKMYQSSSDTGKEIIGNVFHLEPEDIKAYDYKIDHGPINIDYYSSLISEILENGLVLKDELQKNEITLFLKGEEYFLLDNHYNVFIDGNELDLEYDIVRSAAINSGSYYSDNINDYLSVEDAANILGNSLNDVFDLLDSSISTGGSSRPKRKR